MKTGNVFSLTVLFVLGVMLGLFISRESAVDYDPVNTLSLAEPDNAGQVMQPRFESIDARLDEIIVVLDRLNEKNSVLQYADEVVVANDEEMSEVKIDSIKESKSVENPAYYQEVRERVLDSLMGTTTDFSTLLQSKDMLSLPVEERDKILHELTTRLNDGRLSGELFIPGYSQHMSSKQY